MKYITEGYEPARALQIFEELSAIPRSSGKEEGVVAYLKEFAEKHGFYFRSDEDRNVVIKKPASAGYEDKPAVILQGHTDMVCVKAPGVEHDFDKDPIELTIENGALTAKGTTLGADNGVAVAYMLAILEDDTLAHPALECVFTSMEEIGLVGAGRFDAFDLTAEKFINLDAGGDGVFAVSSAGGATYDFHRKPVMVPASGTVCKLDITGLQGGHSALFIDKYRGNSIKLLGEILYAISTVTEMHIAACTGGVKMNAIAAEADAVITVADPAAAKKAAEDAAEIIKARLVLSDPGFVFTFTEGGEADQVLSAEDQSVVLRSIAAFPSGMIHMSPDLPGLVTTSSNPGILRVSAEDIYFCVCIRCADDHIRDTMCKEFELLADKFGFSTEVVAKFCGWIYDPTSPLRTMAMSLYEEMFGKTPVMEATHGGMEAGEFGAKLPGIDRLAFCADVKMPHQPEEYVSLASFERMYRFLCNLLAKL